MPSNIFIYSIFISFQLSRKQRESWIQAHTSVLGVEIVRMQASEKNETDDFMTGSGKTDSPSETPKKFLSLCEKRIPSRRELLVDGFLNQRA